MSDYKSPISFEDYDRITDTLMYLSDDLTLNFSVALSRKTITGERRFFQWEIMTGSDKYGSNKRSIKRYMNFYFIINSKSDFNSGVVLRPQDVEILIMVIEQKILPWYFGDKKTNAFQMIGEDIALKKFEPVVYTQSEAKYLVFEPIIFSYNEKSTRGIRMSLQSGISADMEIDTFMGFLHILRSDMYATACILANYAKMQPYGINTYNPVGLGAPPADKVDSWNSGFKRNSFLDNVRSKE